MIIIIGLGWPLIALILGIAILCVGICSVLFGVASTWKGKDIVWLKRYSIKQKWGLFALLLGIFSSIGSFVYGFIENNGLFGTLGLLLWIALSLIAAYLCSPLRLSLTGDDMPRGGGNGPIGTFIRLVSLLLIMAFSWIFVLIAIFYKSTWRLFLGIIATFLALIAIGVCIAAHHIGGFDELFKKPLSAEEELELELSTLYNEALEYLESGNYYKAETIFKSLAEKQYSDSARMYQKSNYLSALQSEEGGDYRIASNAYLRAGDYEDAQTGYKRVNYLYGCKLIDEVKFADAIEWLEKASDYPGANELITYAQARELAKNDLLSAKEFLSSLPRDLRDVETMLNAIESYKDWYCVYKLKDKTGDKLEDYTRAELVLTYKQRLGKECELEWKVRLYKGEKYTSYDTDGQMPVDGVLSFTDGILDYDWRTFEITQNEMQISMFKINSKYNWRFESHYTFLKEQ